MENFENLKDDRNKGSIVEGNKCKTMKGYAME